MRACGRLFGGHLQGPLPRDLLVADDFVPFLPFIEIDTGDTAFDVGPHLLHKILHPPKLLHRSTEDDLLLSLDLDVPRAAQFTIRHKATGRLFPVLGPEHGQDVSLADQLPDLFVAQATLHDGLDLVHQVVDDVEGHDLHTLVLDHGRGGWERRHVEAHDHASRGDCQVDVGQSDVPRGGHDEPDPDLILRQGPDRRLDGLAGP
mmetsp:Transcript_22576/g.40504  ORF Transcript_22576/g.40504 Transcript_22576/m.40504 type:complete len:204 (+) Transcript_22576:351-962(+)